MTTIPQHVVDTFLLAALAEDLGGAGDITSAATVPAAKQTSAVLVARQAGCIAGLDLALRTFALVDPEVTAEAAVTDGMVVGADSPLATIAGPARSILTAERVALNVLGRLSGIATATADLVRRIEDTVATIADTRKTTPGLRIFEKMAVRAGGGINHRFGLYDAVLIKDNHIAAVGSAAKAVEQARAHVGHMVKVEVEIESLDDLEPVIAAGADVVMLDNMDPAMMRRAVELTDGRVLLEASGGITAETVRTVAETGVDVISVGWITHSAPSLDVALDFDVLA
jgi:nicotinate-nucleotide pyrophosphorylase (carboxylating)